MKKLHLVCNAHLDLIWLWDWDEGAAEALSTFRVAADFCENYQGFVFNHNEAILYKWVEEYDPQLFLRIRKLVSQKKWHIMGGWYLQPDCNMPSGESIVRQIVTGQKYFLEKFGVQPTTALNFDSFGHSRGIVQILSKCGYHSYMVCRPGIAREAVKGNDFIWKGYDNSEVVVHYSDENYNTAKGKAAEELSSWLKDHSEDECGMFLWGIGNHGGGPSKDDLERITELLTSKEISFSHSTPEEYFKTLDRSKLESFKDALAPESEGCYTSQIRVKQEHRKLENMLYMTEKMLSSATLQGFIDYPKDELDEALFALLEAEFHDALPGTAIKPAEDATLRKLHYGQEIVSKLRARAMFALSAGQKKVVDGETPILVYNPHPYKVHATIDCELVLPKQNWDGDFMDVDVYADEERLDCQLEHEHSNFAMDWRKRAIFKAMLEPSSMNRFDCRFKRRPERPTPTLKTENSLICFNTEDLSVVINCTTGLVDKYRSDGIDYIKPGAFLPIVMNDEYNSWGVGFKAFNDVAGEFTLASPQQCANFSGLNQNVLEPVRVIEDGDVRTVVEALFCFNSSFLCQRYKLPKKGTEMELETRVYWLEKDKLLKLAIPSTLADSKFYGQTMFGSEKLRNDGTETVSQKWCAIESQNNDRAITVVNSGTHGANCFDGEMRITLLRSAGYATSDFHGRLAMSPYILTERMDQGERIYRFWFNIGASEERMKAINIESQIHNEEPYALSYCPSGDGVLPKKLIELDNNILLCAFKKAEYSDNAYIIRLQNPGEKALFVNIKIQPAKVSETLAFAPFEVKSLKLDTISGCLSETLLSENIL